MSGIAEFMAPDFMELWHPFVNGSEYGVRPSEKDGSDRGPPAHISRFPSDAREVHCASLTDILDTLGMSHINFWVLDVEVRDSAPQTDGLRG